MYLWGRLAPRKKSFPLILFSAFISMSRRTLWVERAAGFTPSPAPTWPAPVAISLTSWLSWKQATLLFLGQTTWPSQWSLHSPGLLSPPISASSSHSSTSEASSYFFWLHATWKVRVRDKTIEYLKNLIFHQSRSIVKRKDRYPTAESKNWKV